ncbi:MAG: FAD/NAD(P)-binding oxidoreductase [Caldilineaceae bacterium]
MSAAAAPGLTVAAHLRNAPDAPEIAIIEPSSKHYYQPIWTLVGAGVFDRSISERDEADYIPEGATWIQDAVATFDPDNNTVTTTSGKTIGYDYLVVAAGIKVMWDAIPGLKESVGQPGTGVCSNYSFDTVGSTWENIRNLKRGTALFTQPNTPIKCGGAPQKITYLAEDHWRKAGVRDNIDIHFFINTPGIFSVQKYKQELEKVVARKKLNMHYQHHLVALRPDAKEADFASLQSGEKVTMQYDMIHVTPPQGPLDFIKNSPLAADTGWVSVHKETMQHTKYPNVFSCGDCSNLPTPLKLAPPFANRLPP